MTANGDARPGAPSIRITWPRASYWGAWSLAALYNFLRGVFDTSFLVNLVFNLSHFFVWACLGLLLVPLMRRYPIRWHWRSIFFHLFVGAVFAELDITLGHYITATVFGAHLGNNIIEIGIYAFKDCFHAAFLTYCCLLGVVQGLDAARLAKERAVQVAEHKAAMVRAQLQSLKMQLQPHFLFNTLHSISSYMYYDVQTADRMLTRLSELLRISLKEADHPVVSLKQEIAFIDAYLDIEKMRFEHRLNVAWDIPDALGEDQIPPFILQPLVENAIKHGIAPHAAGGNIIIRAYTEAASLLLEVENDKTPETSAHKGFGIGLRNTRARLETLYGVGEHFELIRNGLGTVARVRLPRLSFSVAST